MRVGEKCIFTVDKDMFGGKIKAGHKYVGKCAGDLVVLYRNYRINVKSIKKAEKTPVIKEKAPTASDYKNCGDMLFETGIRYRDKWHSIISGERFAEGDWNGLQAGHGVSRQHWATRHNPLNCHAITSGQNFHMSLGTTKTIATYWAYVGRKYGQDVVDELLNNNESPKLTIAYLKEDCKKQYDFLEQCLLKWNNYMGANRTADEVIKWRCEKFPKAKTDGIMKVLKIIKGEI